MTSRLREWRPGIEAPVAAYGAEDDPVATCPELGDHLGWLDSVQQAEAELRRLRRRARRLGGGLVETFEDLLALLETWGYVTGWTLTDKGERLRFIYGELDLRVVEAVSEGLFDGLDTMETAALASAFVYEPRSEEAPGGWPTPRLVERGKALDEVDRRLAAAESEAGLPQARPPHHGFAADAHAWASGADLDDLLAEGLAAGDLVRNCRQVLDLLRQLGDAFPEVDTRPAIVAVDRGVVAVGGVG